MSSNETKVNVLAVMRAAASWCSDHDAEAARELADGTGPEPGLPEAMAAVAELIAADRELDAAVEAYHSAHSFQLGDREYVSADDPAVLRLDAAKARRAAALAALTP